MVELGESAAVGEPGGALEQFAQSLVLLLLVVSVHFDFLPQKVNEISRLAHALQAYGVEEANDGVAYVEANIEYLFEGGELP